jgi:hypothetical protein
MAGHQQGTPKRWLFLPDADQQLGTGKAISGIGLLAHHLLESMVNPRAASRPLVSALIA